MLVTVLAFMPPLPFLYYIYLVEFQQWPLSLLIFFSSYFMESCLLQYQDSVVSFPLYNEALKFANHGEKMIQTAIRALTLNTYNGIVLLSFLSSPSRRYLSNIVCKNTFLVSCNSILLVMQCVMTWSINL